MHICCLNFHGLTLPTLNTMPMDQIRLKQKTLFDATNTN